jgi:hypothetical protein
MIPWKFILGLVLPSIPDIIATVKTLKKEQKHETDVLNDTAAQILQLEKRVEAQLQVIEQMMVQMGKIEKLLMWTLWAAIFALVLAMIALGLAASK